MENTASKKKIEKIISVCLLLIFMVIVLVLAYKADIEMASNQEMDVSNREITADNYLLFETGDKEEYLQFLNELDASDTYELSFVSIEASYYGAHRFNYSIVYKKCTGEKDPTRYEYYLFESDFFPHFFESDFEKRKKDEFWFFLDNLSNNYEVVDISIGTYCSRTTSVSKEPKKMYFVTYRKPV